MRFSPPWIFPKGLRYLGYCVFQKGPIVKGPIVKGPIVRHVFKPHSNYPKFWINGTGFKNMANYGTFFYKTFHYGTFID